MNVVVCFFRQWSLVFNNFSDQQTDCFTEYRDDCADKDHKEFRAIHYIESNHVCQVECQIFNCHVANTHQYWENHYQYPDEFLLAKIIEIRKIERGCNPYRCINVNPSSS